jgi:hypothetical protein
LYTKTLGIQGGNMAQLYEKREMRCNLHKIRRVFLTWAFSLLIMDANEKWVARHADVG